MKIEEDDKPSQALQLGFELALKDRDAVLREKAKASEERDNAIRQLQQVKSERDQAINSLENLTGKPAKLSNTKKFEDSPPLKRSSSPNLKAQARSSSMESDSGEVEELYCVTPGQTGDNVVWETHKVHLTKAPVFGFGIAVSGGVDSPHFANGDPSIAISDVLRAGPAEGKLQVNDRINSVNNISLENVDHSRAIQVLRDCGNSVHLVIRRRVVLPNILESEVPPLKVTLSKKSKKDDFGVILGCKFYIKDIPGQSLAAQEGGLKVGDTVLKINNTTTENLSLLEARKLIEKSSKDKLQLIVSKRKDISHKKQNSQPKDDVSYQPGFDTLRRQQDKEDINIYRPSVRSEDDIPVYKAETLPRGSGGHPVYPDSMRYDGRYAYDEGPPRPPLPTGFDENQARSSSPGQPQVRLNPEDYYHKYNTPGYSTIDGRLTVQDYDGRQILVDDDVFNTSHEEPEPRCVSFRKDADVGLGLRLAGGNATGTFIASVTAGCAAEAQGLTEGDQILKAWITDHGVKANEREITGMTREEAVDYLTSLQGEVTLVVQYKKEEYDRIMASHEAGDSFYIKTHFHFDGDSESGEHSFNIGDLFHIKDTLFRGVGGSWLAIKLDKNFQETKKGTLPNTHKAETICQYQQQQNNDKENYPNKGRGSLFRRKAARRAKSLGKDHWEELIFSGVHTKFSAYQRVVLREAGFVRPVVIFGGISDIARDKLLSVYPERFEAPQNNESSSEDSKKKSGIIRLGSIRDILTKRKHALIDITPHHVDRLNYAQYCPIVIFIKADNKQAIKDCRSKWKTSSKNPKKLMEHNEKLEKLYAHLFTGVINHNSSDNWFPKLCEMIEGQNRQKIWMSEKKPEDDISDDFLFPMPNRMSYAGPDGGEVDPNGSQTLDRKDKGKLVRSSSDPSINVNDKIPTTQPYHLPSEYTQKGYDERILYNDDHRDHTYYRDERGRPEDHYYPSYYAQNSPSYSQNRTNIDPYATITPSERLRHRSMDVGPNSNAYSHHNGRLSSDDAHRPQYSSVQKLSSTSPYTSPHSAQHNHKSGHTDTSSHSSDSYNRYVSSPSNKHDDSKLRDKFGSLVITSGKRPEKTSPHDPYRFTRSTINPVSSANVDRTKISDLSAKYRKEDQKVNSPNTPSSSRGPPPPVAPKTKREPPPVPVKNYALKERGVVFTDEKSRNYENSNRNYNYQDYSSPSRHQYNGTDNAPHPYSHDTEGPYEYISIKHPNSQIRDLRQNGVDRVGHRPVDNHSNYHPSNHNNSYDNQIYSSEYYTDNIPYDRNVKSFANQIYMDHGDVDTIRTSKEQLRSEYYPPIENGYTRPRNGEKVPEDQQNGIGAFKAYRKSQPMSTFGKKDSATIERQSPLKEQNPPGKSHDIDDRMDFGREINENHTVLATARGSFDSKGGVLESRETGVSIIIPPGALPDGPKQEIYFKVCKDNSILPPLDKDKGETLLSPLVMCGPHGLTFNHPVELRLPHCAAVNPDSWSFALKSSDSPSGHPTQWQNMNLAGMDGVSQGKVGKNSVSVMVDHF